MQETVSYISKTTTFKGNNTVEITYFCNSFITRIYHVSFFLEIHLFSVTKQSREVTATLKHAVIE